ncbi:helix-turn-helix transcriptional regulator [Aquimarina litoralis]|uniref:helix-turn-helix transcriptional regulator n=1 Tax=Aquimarina litoralis TaxID=584605 RepID=UPI001C58E428|nr:helix-turn-helix domain-containing protein [Aquimarina litoralis]MBW1297778.1 helix-turn-helix domain-containing protein [Aquimarina litoralis]
MKKPEFIIISIDDLKNVFSDEIRSQLKSFSERFKPVEPEEFITVETLCKEYHIHRSTAHKYSKEGILKKYSLGGGRVLYKRSEVEAALIELK